MLPDRTDPDRRLSIEERIASALSQAERGVMTEAVLRATLFGCGKRGNELETLVRLYRPTPPLADVSAPIISAFVSGLA